MIRKPGFVPLPEVERYSDVITLGSLGFPSGFDEERIELHVGRLERAVYFGGIKSVILSSYRGDTTQYQVGATGDNNQGLATATFAASVSKAEAGQIESSHDELAHPDYSWQEVAIKFNNAEIDDRLHGADLGPMDAKQRARLMNKVATSQLLNNILNTETSPTNLIAEGITRGFHLLVYQLALDNSVQKDLMISTMAIAAWGPISDFFVPDYRKDGPFKHSLFASFRIDRLGMAATQLALPIIRGHN